MYGPRRDARKKFNEGEKSSADTYPALGPGVLEIILIIVVEFSSEYTDVMAS